MAFSATPTGIKLIGRDSDGTTTDVSVVASDPQSTKQPIYDLNGIEMKSEKGIYIKGGKVRIKN